MTGAALLAFLQCEYESARARLRGGDRGVPARWTTATARRGRSSGSGRSPGSRAATRTRSGSTGRASRSSRRRTVRRRPDRDLGYTVFILWLRGDFEAAAALGAEALEAIRPAEQGERLVWAMLNLGAVATYRGDLGAARSLLSESLTVSEEIGYREGIAWSFNLLGVVSCRVDDYEAAEELLRDSLELHRALGDQWRSASVLEGLALCAAARSESVRAARLLGAAEAIRTRIGVPIPTCEQGDHDRHAGDGRGGARCRRAWSPPASPARPSRSTAWSRPRGWGSLAAVRAGRRPPVASR